MTPRKRLAAARHIGCAFEVLVLSIAFPRLALRLPNPMAH